MTNPEKLSLLLDEYEKRQIQLDEELSKAIKSQIECINQSKESVAEGNRNMQEASDRIENIKDAFMSQIEFHEVMQEVGSLDTFQRNTTTAIEQLAYFINMDEELNKLQKMAEDESKYLFISSKLLSLIELRNAILEDVTWKA